MTSTSACVWECWGRNNVTQFYTYLDLVIDNLKKWISKDPLVHCFLKRKWKKGKHKRLKKLKEQIVATDRTEYSCISVSMRLKNSGLLSHTSWAYLGGNENCPVPPHKYIQASDAVSLPTWNTVCWDWYDQGYDGVLRSHRITLNIRNDKHNFCTLTVHYKLFSTFYISILLALLKVASSN